jgi:hypothetical protein
MNPRAALLSLASLSVLSAVAAAAPMPGESYPLDYTITKGLNFQPIDLAVYAPIGINMSYLSHSLFVVDAQKNQLLRYFLAPDGSRQGNTAPEVWYDAGASGQRITAVAADDNLDSPNFGLVHIAIEDLNYSMWQILTFDTTGMMVVCSVRLGADWGSIKALAVDKHGDVYVADSIRFLTERYGAAQFSQWYVCGIIDADATYAPAVSSPADVTVTESDLVLVVDNAGKLMASNRDGSDFFDRNQAVPVINRLTIDAHDESERLWMAVDATGAPSPTARRVFFNDCYANNGASRTTDGVTNASNGGGFNGPARIEYSRFFTDPSITGLRCCERVFVADPVARRITCHQIERIASAPSPAPVARWHFDETGTTVIDASAFGNDGTFNWNAPAREEGMVKTGLVFSDAIDGVHVPTSPSLNMGTGSFTAECWVRTCDTRGVRNILDKRKMSGTAAVRGYALYLYHGKLAFQLAANNTWWNVGATGSGSGLGQEFVADGLFHHVAVVVDRDVNSTNVDTVAFYVDGAQVGTHAAIPLAVQGTVSNGAPLLIARHPVTGDAAGLSGELDDITLYKKALSAGTIATIYAQRGAGKL